MHTNMVMKLENEERGRSPIPMMKVMMPTACKSRESPGSPAGGGSGGKSASGGAGAAGPASASGAAGAAGPASASGGAARSTKNDDIHRIKSDKTLGKMTSFKSGQNTR